MKYIANLSYGKDSIYMLEIIKKYNLPLDEIVTCDIWATNMIPAELPPMIEFKKYADAEIYNRYGLKVKHLKGITTYEEYFYKIRGKRAKKENQGKIYGFPILSYSWCQSNIKTYTLNKYIGKKYSYIGYAIDEKNKKRQKAIKDYLNNKQQTNKIYPLADYNIPENVAFNWCKKNGLLAPCYEHSIRGGCWFCHQQSIEQLKYLRKNYTEYWNLMLKWDKDSPTTFRSDGITIRDLDKRFAEQERRNHEYIFTV